MKIKKRLLKIFISIVIIVTSFLAGFFANSKKPINYNKVEQKHIKSNKEIDNFINNLKETLKMAKETIKQIQEIKKLSDQKANIDKAKRNSDQEDNLKEKYDIESYEKIINDLKQSLKAKEEFIENQIRINNKSLNEQKELTSLEKNKVISLTNQINSLLEEQAKLRRQVDLNRITIKEFQSKFFVKEIFVPQGQIDKQNNRIFASEFDIIKVLKFNILKQIRNDIDNSLTLKDFLVKFESKYSKNGLTFIELTEPKVILIKIVGVNAAKDETTWLELHLPKAQLIK